MPHDLTHASFFSGVGGLDMGLERAGWRTVSFSEIDLYASAVLAERWPGVPNLGDITAVSDSCRRVDGEAAARIPDTDCPVAGHDGSFRIGSGRDVGGATLWTGGFPCQDLSVAGKRRGMGTEDDRTRSGLAYAFLDLVERHRPPAILLENVPGLLSSNGGKDFGALLGRLAELGYWWAYRILDAQFFGVPQRRRRVFICALHAGAGFGADSPAAVLSVGARCDGHSATGDEAGERASERPVPGVDIARAVTGTSGKRHDDDTDTDTLLPMSGGGMGGMVGRDARLPGMSGDGGDMVIHPLACQACGHWWDYHLYGPCDFDGFAIEDERVTCGCEQRPSPDPGGVRAADGLAGRLDDREVVGFAQNQRGEVRELGGVMSQLTAGGGKPGEGYPAVFTKRARVSGPDTPETWEEGGPMSTLNSFDVGDIRTTAAVIDFGQLVDPNDDKQMLPLGLDSHRYRCCGNGVVSNVSEWIGVRLAAVMA
jgi:DNA-cytosine methyltransferase